MALVENTLTEIYGPPVETQQAMKCPAGPPDGDVLAQWAWW